MYNINFNNLFTTKEYLISYFVGHVFMKVQAAILVTVFYFIKKFSTLHNVLLGDT